MMGFGPKSWAVALTALLCPFGAQAGETCQLRFSSGAALTARSARTVEEQAQGLSGGTGQMIFIWATAEPRVFWMQDTPAPLDVGFLDTRGVVFDIQAMPVDTSTGQSRQYYFSVQPALYALELPAGGFARHGITLGDQLTTFKCRQQAANAAP